MSHCVRNSSLTIIWNNLGLSNYKHIKRKLGLKKKTDKNTCYNFKRNYVVPYSKESHLTLMHLWHLSTIPSFWVEYFAECLLKGVSYMFFLSKFKIPFNKFDKTDPNYSKWYSVTNSWNRVTQKHFWNLIALFLPNLNAKKNTYVSEQLLI